MGGEATEAEDICVHTRDSHGYSAGTNTTL